MRGSTLSPLSTVPYPDPAIVFDPQISEFVLPRSLFFVIRDNMSFSFQGKVVNHYISLFIKMLMRGFGICQGNQVGVKSETPTEPASAATGSVRIGSCSD